MTHSRRAADHGDLPPGCPYSRGSQLEFALAAFHLRVGSGKGSVGGRAGRGAITPSLIPQPSCWIDRILSGSAFLSTITPNQGSTISSEVRLPPTRPLSSDRDCTGYSLNCRDARPLPCACPFAPESAPPVRTPVAS